MTKIIDVSNNNGHVDFAAARKAGAVGVYLKVTEGAGFVDSTYLANRRAAKAAGLKVGGYHFAHPENSGSTEASFFLAHLVYEPGDLVPMLDMELDRGKPKPYTTAFVAAARARHGHCGLYCGGWFITKYGLESVRPRWIPSYGARPTMPCEAWQFSDGQAKYPGAILRLDTSYVYDMEALAPASPSPKPSPTPAPQPVERKRKRLPRWVTIDGLRMRRGGKLYRWVMRHLRRRRRNGTLV